MLSSVVELRQTSEYASYLRKLGWNSRKVQDSHIYWKKIPLIGSVIKLQRPTSFVSLQVLGKLAKEVRAFEIIIELLSEKQRAKYLKASFKKSNSPSLPSKTVILDLGNSETKLLSEMHHKTRYNVKVAKRKGVVVRESSDIELFSKLWHKSARKRKMYLSQKKEIKALYDAFKNKSILLFAKLDEEVLGGVLVIHTSTISYYMYAASTEAGYKNFAPTLLAWEAIRRAKKRGLKHFDFEGIYDSRYPLKTWKGFSRFKKSFGGAEHKFPGPLVKRRLPI